MFSMRDLEEKSGLNGKAIAKFLKIMWIEPSRTEGKTMFWDEAALSTLLNLGPKPRTKRNMSKEVLEQKPKQPIEPPVTRQEFDQLKIELAQVKHVLKIMHARYSGK